MGQKTKGNSKTAQRKRPDVSFNFGANARSKGSKSSAYIKNRYASGGGGS
jgi:hypothetical protein